MKASGPQFGRVLSALALLTLLSAPLTLAQQPMDPSGVPPPIPPKPRPDEEEVPPYESIVPQSDDPWGLDTKLLLPLYDKADVYSDYTRRFTCDETARTADYGKDGEASDERTRRYSYLLTQNSANLDVSEFRQMIGKDGEPKKNPVKDEEPFPPAYAWVFLFSRSYEPYFSYRFVDDRFDGFDWVLEIQFKGSVPFSDGKDIRQWEGTVLVDAVTHTPLEIHAEPTGQAERIEALYRQHASSFNFMGMRSKPKPLGYRADIQFRYRRDGLTFPTDLRYDTFRAVSPHQVMPTKASTRSYSRYRFYGTEVDDPEFGDVAGSGD